MATSRPVLEGTHLSHPAAVVLGSSSGYYWNMNKAFVKEPDPSDTGHCPKCGSLGTAVGPATLGSHLTEVQRRGLAENACFCPYPRCDCAYFDMFDRVIGVSELRAPVYPKALTAPICPCFGFTVDEIEQDVLEGSVERVRALLAKAKTPAARCVTAAASGQSCAAEVQRYYMRFRQQRSSGGAG